MTHDEDQQKKFDSEDYPALMEFLPAYLHEDFIAEYGSAADAMSALMQDASGDQIANLKEDWKALRAALAGKPVAEWHHALRAMGAAWQPQSEEELRGVDEILSGTEA